MRRAGYDSTGIQDSKPVNNTIMQIDQIPTTSSTGSSSPDLLRDSSGEKVETHTTERRQSINYDNDQLLQRQGYQPELERNFSFWSLLGVAFGLTNSWLGIAGGMGETIAAGGPLMVVYGLIALFVFVLPVGVTLSELVSMFPNSGGQYFWTFQLAPKKNARFLLFLTGQMGWLGAVFTCSSVSLTTLQSILASYQLTHPDFEQHPWHVLVCCILIVLFVSIFNCWEKPLPTITFLAFAMSLFTFFVAIIACLATSHGNYQSGSFVFTELINVEKDMIGITFLVSLTLPTWALAGLDALTHMSEELPQPAKTIPKLIISTIIIGFLTLFIFSVSLFFCIKDVQLVMSAPLPLLEIIYQLLNYNKAGLIFVELLLILTAIFCNISANTWQLRICWSFSRDNGLPFSQYWKQVSPRTNVPIKAHLFSNFICILIAIVYLGSSNAYTSIVTASVEVLYFSYFIPTVCLLKKGRSKMRPGPFWMGKIGLVCNYLTCFWVCFCLIFFSFPYEMPATLGNMNYVSAVYLGCFLYIFIYWFAEGRYKFVSLEERLYDPGEIEIL